MGFFTVFCDASPKSVVTAKLHADGSWLCPALPLGKHSFHFTHSQVTHTIMQVKVRKIVALTLAAVAVTAQVQEVSQSTSGGFAVAADVVLKNKAEVQQVAE